MRTNVDYKKNEDLILILYIFGVKNFIPEFKESIHEIF